MTVCAPDPENRRERQFSCAVERLYWDQRGARKKITPLEKTRIVYYITQLFLLHFCCKSREKRRVGVYNRISVFAEPPHFPMTRTLSVRAAMWRLSSNATCELQIRTLSSDFLFRIAVPFRHSRFFGCVTRPPLRAPGACQVARRSCPAGTRPEFFIGIGGSLL